MNSDYIEKQTIYGNAIAAFMLDPTPDNQHALLEACETLAATIAAAHPPDEIKWSGRDVYDSSGRKIELAFDWTKAGSKPHFMHTTPKERNEALVAASDAALRGEFAKEVNRLAGIAFGLSTDYYTKLFATINPDDSAAAYEARIRHLEVALATSRALYDDLRKT
jgi:hypothetical protein